MTRRDFFTLAMASSLPAFGAGRRWPLGINTYCLRFQRWNDRQLFDWDDFRGRLIERISQGDSAGDPSTYYERWLGALEALLLDRGFVTPAELDARTAEYASGERDDDHDDDDDHHH